MGFSSGTVNDLPIIFAFNLFDNTANANTNNNPWVYSFVHPEVPCAELYRNFSKEQWVRLP